MIMLFKDALGVNEQAHTCWISSSAENAQWWLFGTFYLPLWVVMGGMVLLLPCVAVGLYVSDRHVQSMQDPFFAKVRIVKLLQHM